jgi:hypothetical protein
MMTLFSRIRVTWMMACLSVFACVEPYAPPAVANAPHLLVVDGFFNAADGTVKVKLSRTIALSADGPAPKETNAMVTLEDETGADYLLYEVLPGEYLAEGVSANTDTRYRLHVITDNQDYYSDFVSVTVTPAIESLELNPKSDGLEIQLSTHDQEENSKYYRWTFSETYEYFVAYSSSWLIENNEARIRTTAESIYRCWRTDVAHNILIGSSTAFSEDRITDFVVTKVPRGSMKLLKRYSIQVQQQALTPDGYAYWQGLYRTTENVGGLFDPLPGQVSGNFYNQSRPAEIVVGFFSASYVTQKRIFVTGDDLPEDYSSFYPGFCPLDTILIEDVPKAGTGTLLYSALYPPSGTEIIGFTVSDISCLDCRYYGGVTTKPDFWP